jgi:hypothetical protein
MDSNHDRVASLAIERLCEELQRWVGTLGPIVAHMHMSQATGASAPDAPPIPEILQSLMSETLAPLADDYGEADVERATALLNDAGRIIAAEIVLVPLDAAGPLPRNGRRRRHRARRRR